MSRMKRKSTTFSGQVPEWVVPGLKIPKFESQQKTVERHLHQGRPKVDMEFGYRFESPQEPSKFSGLVSDTLKNESGLSIPTQKTGSSAKGSDTKFEYRSKLPLQSNVSWDRDEPCNRSWHSYDAWSDTYNGYENRSDTWNDYGYEDRNGTWYDHDYEDRNGKWNDYDYEDRNDASDGYEDSSDMWDDYEDRNDTWDFYEDWTACWDHYIDWINTLDGKERGIEHYSDPSDANEDGIHRWDGDEHWADMSDGSERGIDPCEGNRHWTNPSDGSLDGSERGIDPWGEDEGRTDISDGNEHWTDLRSTTLKKRETSPLQDAVANLIKVVERRCELGKAQAQDEVAHLKKENIKCEKDLILLQNELTAKRDTAFRVQSELVSEWNRSDGLQDKVSALEKRTVCLQDHLITEKRSSKVSADNVERFRTHIQDLESKLHEAEMKIKDQNNKIEGLEFKLHEAEIKIQDQTKKTQGLESKLHEAEAKIENQTKKLLCGICFERPRNALCLPCFHLSSCVPCIEQHIRISKTCPTCRVLRAYWNATD